MTDPLTQLAAHGFPVDTLPAEQQAVLGDLSQEEVTLLIGIKSRLDAVGDEVTAHSEIAGAALF